MFTFFVFRTFELKYQRNCSSFLNFILFSVLCGSFVAGWRVERSATRVSSAKRASVAELSEPAVF